MDIAKIPIESISWMPCFRIIPSRFPPIALFERVTSSEEFEAIYEIEQLTNPRLREEMGNIQLVPKGERLFGEGTSLIMAAFTHLPLTGSRFTDGSFGVYYAGDTLDTAIAETKYHREKFLKDFNSPKIEIDMRVLLADLRGQLHDMTMTLDSDLQDVLHPENYNLSQKIGGLLRKDGMSSWGIHYNSVRHATGKCAAVFRPKILRNCRQERHLCYVWDGAKISHIYRKQFELA